MPGSRIMKLFCALFPVRRNTILFEAYYGREYACNPKAIYEAMQADPAYAGFRYTWVFTDVNQKTHRDLARRPRTRVVRRKSLAYYRAVAQSRYLVSNALQGGWQPKRNQVYIQTWHGKPLKHIGADIGCRVGSGMTPEKNRQRFLRDARKEDFLLSPTPCLTPCFISAFCLAELGKEEIVVENGYPRNDYLFTHTKEDERRIKIALDIPLDKKVVLYMPTWRPQAYEPGTGYIHKPALDYERLAEELGEEYVLLLRIHRLEARSLQTQVWSERVRDVTAVEDVVELYAISDLLITDYSRALFYYANLRRPMLFYMYDREAYTGDLTGCYFDVSEVPGPILTRQEELAPGIRALLGTPFVPDARYEAFLRRYNPLEGPHSAAQLLKKCGVVTETLGNHAWKRAWRWGRRQAAWLKKWLLVYPGGFCRSHGLLLSENARRLRQYRNLHAGQRCFLVGNGPSLRPEDLELIRGEISFGCNMIYKIFDSTVWRPTYHCCIETLFAEHMANEIAERVSAPFFTNYTYYKKAKILPNNTVYAYNTAARPYEVHGNLLAYYVPSLSTVMTFMLELAMYMGFTEIYLLGVDCTSSVNGRGHFTKDYMPEIIDRENVARTKRKLGKRELTLEETTQYFFQRATSAYEVLGRFAEERGIRIYNATRGGALEAFARVNLEDALRGEGA